MTNTDMVQEFIDEADASHEPELWLKLIKEEYEELQAAVVAGDAIAIADANADLEYVIHGFSISLNQPADLIFKEVHRTNMNKRWPDGTFHRREDGKIIKPPGWVGPNIEQFLG